MEVMNKFKPSLGVLIVSNLLVAFGVVFLNWSDFAILWAYWMESLVLGFYTVLKIWKAENFGNFKLSISTPIGSRTLPPNKSIATGFFCFHFGIFMVVHLVILIMISPLFEVDSSSVHANYFNPVTLYLPALLFSHGFSYVVNFIGKKEFKKQTVAELFFAPYSRIGVMQAVVMIGFLVSTPGLILVAIKTAIDLIAHYKEHANIANVSQTPVEADSS